VTPYAAGCAICGADIAAVRAARTSSHSAQVLDRVRLPRLGDDGLRFLIALILVIGTGPIGLLVVCWFAWQLNEEGRILQRNLMIGLAVVGMLPFLFGFSLWSLLLAR
jgi:hypothetical protein